MLGRLAAAEAVRRGVRGEGSRVWDQQGKMYIDFASGVAVTALGLSSGRQTFGHRALQVLVGCREDPDVDAEGRFAADAREFPDLEDVKQLGLKPGVKITDLVEEHRAAVCGLELADLQLVGAGEGATLVAEELALQKLTRHRGTIDLYKGAGATR